MDILKNKTDNELMASLLAEIAKSKNELNCSIKDVQKAQSRLGFVLVLANTLINRKKD